jgi:predicted nucleotidyltransferase
MSVVENPAGVMSTAQHEVATEVLAAEGAARRHLVVYLSGSHSYGFPSPDSDLDLKAVHTESTRRLLGLAPPPAHAARLEVVRGVEVDYTSNEIGAVLAGVLGGNGNYVERLLGDLVLQATAELAELRPLVRRALSRRVHRHYRGFASQQRAGLDAAGTPTAKKLLYVLRTALTGTHLLATGELVTDVTQLLDRHDLSDARELVELKRAGERAPLPEAIAARWRGRLDALFDQLDRARDRSPLPAEPSNIMEVEAWLVAHRLGSAAAREPV